MEAIKAATINAADLLGMKDQLGSIEAGKLADIVAVDGDPLKDAKGVWESSICNEEWSGL